MATGTSSFFEPHNVTLGSYTIFGVQQIDFTSSTDMVKSKDNAKTRYVAFQVVFYNETVSLTFTDFNAYQQLRANAIGVALTLTFDYMAVGNNVASGTLPSQLVTIQNVVLDGDSMPVRSKAEGVFTARGTILGLANGSDPVAFTVGS